MECEVKWALGSITTNKASRGDEIPVDLFQILKDDAMKVLHSTFNCASCILSGNPTIHTWLPPPTLQSSHSLLH